MPTQRQRDDFLNAFADAEIAKQTRRSDAVNAMRAAGLLDRKLKAGEVTQDEYHRQLETIRQTDTNIELTDDEYDFIVGE